MQQPYPLDNIFKIHLIFHCFPFMHLFSAWKRSLEEVFALQRLPELRNEQKINACIMVSNKIVGLVRFKR